LCHLRRQIAEKQHSECIKLSVRRDVYIDAQDFYYCVSKRTKLPTINGFLMLHGCIRNARKGCLEKSLKINLMAIHYYGKISQKYSRNCNIVTITILKCTLFL